MTTPKALPRVLGTGSQTYENKARVWRELDDVYDRLGPFTLVHGGCRKGADAYLSEWARGRAADGVVEEVHPADWYAPCDPDCRHRVRRDTRRRRWCPFAGKRRSLRMVRLGAAECHAFIRNWSPGATYCAEQAQAAGILTVRHVETAGAAA